MSSSLLGRLLHVDLSSQTVEAKEYPASFFRTYLGGGGIGTYFLLRETDADTDALSPENVVTIAPGIATGAAVSGVSRCSVTALSPETGAVGDTQAGGSFGPFLKRSGLDGVVITGKAEKPCHLYIHEGTADIVPSPELAGKSILDVQDVLSGHYTGKVSIIQCGPAGEKLVRFSALSNDLYHWGGRTGMGAVFGSKNLRAVVVSGQGNVQFSDPEAVKQLARTGAQRVKNGESEPLHTYGTPGIVKPNALKGNIATHNFSTGYHEDYLALDGSTFDEKIGSKGTTCYGCAVGCRKTVSASQPFEVTDRLGGPEFETIGLLGTNLDITDPVAVAKANELCNNYGIDTITLGSLVSYLFELNERGLIPDELRSELPKEGFGSPQALFDIIELIRTREGIGDILAEGIERTVEYFGEETSQYAVRSKNHGFAAHMTQVKQSMALMYAVSPIGADHMSCEHDWLAADDSEVAQGLGLHHPGEEISYGEEKVRAVLYSQYYYGALDSLGLCMFCWGPGSLYDYQELVELLRATSGLQITLWELLTASRRRITMMRMLNMRRGFTRADDRLPERVFEPLSGGPSKGRSVDRVGFETMVDLYYEMVGWNEHGVPLPGTLKELDLSWTAAQAD